MTIGVGLEIAIALVALFWLLSTVASFIVEAFNSLIFNVRASALERFVCEMVLGDGIVRQRFKAMKGKLSQSLAADPLGLLSHGMIMSLRKPKAIAHAKGTAPSYIPAEVFAKVLLDRLAMLAAAALPAADVRSVLVMLVGNNSPLPQDIKGQISSGLAQAQVGGEMFATTRRLVERWHTLTANQALPEIQALANAVGGLTGAPQVKTFLTALLNGVCKAIKEYQLQTNPSDANRPLSQLIGEDPAALWIVAMRLAAQQPALSTSLVDAVRQVVDHAPLPSALRDALRPIVAQANFDLDAIRTGIEAWYDDVMQRASGWFKRHTTWLLGICGLVLAILLNVNPFLIVGDLGRDPALRAAGVAVAESAVAHRGEPELVQQLMFAEAAKRLNWSTRIDGALKDEKGEGLPSLAFEMGPLLLRSGHYVGFLPGVRDDRNPKDWDDNARKDLCSAYLEAKQPAGRSLGAATTGDLREHCKEVLEPLPLRKAENSNIAFWSNIHLFWNANLSGTLYKALAATDKLNRACDLDAAKPDPDKLKDCKSVAAESLSAFNAAYQNAFKEAETVSKSAQDFLSRIPSVGVLPPWKRWSSFSAFGLDVIGWLLTAMMVSFGAPFWFDLMTKLVDSRRATGPKPTAEAT